MTTLNGHIANDVLLRAMDDELLPSESAAVELHLTFCEECRERYKGLCEISESLESFANSMLPASPIVGRQVLEQKISKSESHVLPLTQRKVMLRFGWGMALAATLALGIFFAPGSRDTSNRIPEQNSKRRLIDTFEVNGETFVALPYSNADLPVSNSHIVEMQVPVSSLTDAGVAFEAVTTQPTALDHSVLADVLIGMDGQPLGVHVLSE